MYAVELIAGQDKDKFWLVEEDWTEASTTRCDLDEMDMWDEKLMIFENEKAAHSFMETFEGHPYWASPVHKYWLVKVKRKTRIEIIEEGWEIDNDM